MKNRLKKILLAALASFEIFGMTVSIAFAAPTPSASSVASEIESRYHVDLESIQNQAEYLNTSDNKMISPQIMLSFNPQSPQLGEKITALAAPLYFANEKENLYFTWYLKHSECKLSKKSDGDYLKKCDLNNDERVNEEDWKIEAMRMIANGGFNTASANYETTSNDNDGYSAIFGGSNKEKMPEHCYIHDFKTGDNYELVKDVMGDSMECPVGTEAKCVRNQTLTCVPGGVITNYEVCSDSLVDPVCSSTTQTPSCTVGTPLCVDTSQLGGDCDTVSASQTCTDLGFTTTPTCSSATPDIKTLCKHLFPNAPGHKTGDGNFNNNEEKFWRTNPEDPDTANSGNRDEANVAGLGQDTFSWNYEPGDKIGVVVEGAAVLPTKYNDSSQMVMWALPKNKCEVDAKGTMLKNIKGYDVKIPIAKKNINDCIKDNLVNPLEEGNLTKLDVSLSYDPKNPTNDRSNNNLGDEVMLNATVINAQNNTYLKYEWRLYESDDINPADGWGNPLLKSEIPGASQTSGIGINTFKFKMDFANPKKYIRVEVSATESNGETKSEGRTDVIIPISSASHKIRTYSTTVSDNLLLSSGGQERCNEGMDSAICPVAKDEIVAMEVTGEGLTNFSWLVDDQPVLCLSSDCSADIENSSKAFFPVLKNSGEQYTVTMTATGDKNEKIILTKIFEVVNPEVKITSLDSKVCAPILLGNYIDLDNKAWPDYSDTDYQAAPDSIISLKPVFNNSSTKNYVWYIDGIEMNTNNLPAFGASIAEDGTLTFPASKQVGDSYNVAIKALYTQNNNTKKFLNKTANVQLSEFYENIITDNIYIKMTSSISGTGEAKTNTPRQFLASLFVGLPAYISFLFRIVLTTMLILVTSWIVLSLSPKIHEE